MSNTLPITIEGGALPPNASFTPQQFFDAMVARMSLVTSGVFALFVAGSTAPTSDVGPWWKDNRTWYYFNPATGVYEPQTVAAASLGYTIGSAAPDPNIFSVWLETTAGGSPLAVKIYYSGAWVDVYAAALASYQTVAAMAGYSTTAQMTAAIAAAVAAVSFPTYPARGGNAAPQSIPIDATPHLITIDAAPINPAPAPLDITTSRYVAPASGIYAIAITSQFTNNTGTASGMEVIIALYKNSVDSGLGAVSAVPSPPGSQWFPGGAFLIQLAVNDFIELWADVSDGVNTGLIDLTTCAWSIHRISS